jgi:hypothetical protein
MGNLGCEEEMDKDKARYIVRYYDHLLNQQERRAYRHLEATLKATHGRADAAAQQEAKSGRSHLREWLSEEPEVLRLASEGLDTFMLHTAERVFRDHQDKIVLNCCPRCGALAKTPKAQQCRFCGHDWHSAQSPK